MIEPPPQYRGRTPLFAEATELTSIGPDRLGREAWLEPNTARAWQSMQVAATAAGATLWIVSAFRSIARQEEIVAGKLRRGQSWEQILKVSAFPGFSEHHTGPAIDLATPECPDLVEEFETTAAFRWLDRHAGGFGFALSYPRDNPHGVAYEPWHWRWHDRRGKP